MAHAVTLGDVLLGAGALAGFGLIVAGLLLTLAGGMADAPQAGETAGRQGCAMLFAGWVVAMLCCWGLLA